MSLHCPQILLLTLQIAFPSVVRLVVCTGVLYIAFMFLGWLVLGPYHAKVCVCVCVCVHQINCIKEGRHTIPCVTCCSYSHFSTLNLG